MKNESLPPKESDFYCSHASTHHNESLTGTAPEVNTWILLEYPGRWGEKALKESDISERIKSKINAYLDSDKKSKFLFIRNSNSGGSAQGFRLFIAKADPSSFSLYTGRFGSYDDLESVNFEAPESSPELELSDDKLFLVCTNGKRDKCCAKYGLPALNAMEGMTGISAWETTHLGQHRFAANILVLPEGIYYGRVSPDNISAIADNHLNGDLTLEYLRGRAAMSKPQQAAESLLRSKLGVTGIYDLTISPEKESGDNAWQITIQQGQEIHILEVVKENKGIDFYASCKGDKTVVLTEFVLSAHETKASS